MVSPLLLLSGIGMMLVAIIAVLYWKRKTKTALRYFLYGSALWVVAILAKIAMNLTVTGPLYYILRDSYSEAVFISLLGLYVGLQTGLFESGLSYIAVLKTKLRKMNFNEAVAFGIGFGALEAFLLGLASFISILTLMLIPELELQLSPDQLLQLSMSGWVIAASIVERLATIFIHIFASVLVIYSVRSGKINFLVISILYKTLVDGMIPLLTNYIEFTAIGILLIEVPIIIIAMAGFFGTKWLKKLFTKIARVSAKKRTVVKLPRRKRRR